MHGLAWHPAEHANRKGSPRPAHRGSIGGVHRRTRIVRKRSPRLPHRGSISGVLRFPLGRCKPSTGIPSASTRGIACGLGRRSCSPGLRSCQHHTRKGIERRRGSSCSALQQMYLSMMMSERAARARRIAAAYHMRTALNVAADPAAADVSFHDDLMNTMYLFVMRK